MRLKVPHCCDLNAPVSPRFLPGSPKPLGPKDVVGFRDGYLKGINEVTRVGPEPEGLGSLEEEEV